MRMFEEVVAVYLHREPVDFRKSINGLSLVVETAMGLSPLSGAVFVFCNRRRDKLKILYWKEIRDRPRLMEYGERLAFNYREESCRGEHALR